MFSFFGSKWRLAHKYPPPLADVPVVEPFAGGGCYSLRHNVRRAILVEKDPEIAELWRYLIAATPEQILALPDIEAGQRVSDLEVEPGAAALIGFSLRPATTHAARTAGSSTWSQTHPDQFWSQHVRERVASQVDAIKDWVVIHGDYSDAPDIYATWFVDSPYQRAGTNYRFGSKALDFEELGTWCQTRKGRVMVCENEGADWLPFEPLATVKAATHRSGEGRVSVEVVWYGNDGQPQQQLWGS